MLSLNIDPNLLVDEAELKKEQELRDEIYNLKQQIDKMQSDISYRIELFKYNLADLRDQHKRFESIVKYSDIVFIISVATIVVEVLRIYKIF